MKKSFIWLLVVIFLLGLFTSCIMVSIPNIEGSWTMTYTPDVGIPINYSCFISSQTEEGNFELMVNVVFYEGTINVNRDFDAREYSGTILVKQLLGKLITLTQISGDYYYMGVKQGTFVMIKNM